MNLFVLFPVSLMGVSVFVTGKLGDVVLGYDSIQEYQVRFFFFFLSFLLVFFFFLSVLAL